MNLKVIAWQEGHQVKVAVPAAQALREGMDLDTFYAYVIQRTVPEEHLGTVQLLNKSDLPRTKANRSKWKLVDGKIKVEES